MIEYKYNSEQNEDTNNHLTDMKNVLEEIATTYTILLELVTAQESAISSPAIDEFRAEFKKSIGYGIKLAQRISDNSTTLVDLSHQTSQHLQAIEDTVSPRLNTAAKKVTVV